MSDHKREDTNPDHNDGGVAIVTKTEESSKTTHYPMYKVIMHNDSKTTMDFVVMILQQIFNKEYQQARKIMMEIHKKGQGLAGVYTKEHAELRVEMTHSQARARKFPLTCTIEPE